MKNQEKFKELLDQRYNWPCSYRFKFIVPFNQVNNMRQLFAGEDLQFRPSSKGNYQSVTFFKDVTSSEHVLHVYEKVENIPGVISL